MKQKIVIIGGGLAGCLLCNELVKKFKVTLLEKGVKNSIRYPLLDFQEKKLAEVNTCCYGGGGTTNLWHNGLIPINSEDLTDPDFREVMEDANTYMDQAAAALFYTGTSYSMEHQCLKEEVNSLSPALAAFPYGIDSLIYPKSYRKLTVESAVNAIYDVDDVNFVFEKGKVVSIYYSINGKQYTLNTDMVIIAGGALNTPGLLQKLTRATGSPSNEIGLGFIDHPMGFVGKVKIKKEFASLIRNLSAWDKGRYISRNAVRLRSSCGNYTSCAFFRPALTMDNRLDIYKYKSSLGAANGLKRLQNIFSWKLIHPDIIAEVFAHLFGVNLPSRTYNILFIAEQKRQKNRIYAGDGIIHVKWEITASELSIYRAQLEELKKMLTGLADDINIKTNISDEWLWSAAHHSGTTSLGTSDTDLVDKNLRLKCSENVYVCDGSVLQEHSYANTGLAIGQLAFRLAHRISHGA